MASPQVENGYTKIANEIMEALMQYNLPGEQTRVLLCIIRASYGWNEKFVSITHAEIAEQTGMKRQSVTRAIGRLATKRLLNCNETAAKQGKCLIFNKNYDEWVAQPKKEFGNETAAGFGSSLVAESGITPINRKKRKKGEQSKKYTPPTGDDLKKIEPWINTQAWDEWIAYRIAIKKQYKTKQGVTKAVNVLRPFNHSTQQEIIDLSISSEYQGLFPPKGPRRIAPKYPTGPAGSDKLL